MVAPILEYPVRPPEPPERLALEEGPDFVRVIFPVSPAWSYVALICVFASVGIFDALIPAMWVFHWWTIIHHHVGIHDLIGISVWNSLYLAVRWLGDILFWLLLAAYAWWRYRRWGRVPPILLATREGVAFSRLGLFGMRQKYWPANEITAVKIRPVFGNLSRRQTIAKLNISSSGRSKQFRLASSDPQLSGIIAERIRSLLGCSPPVV